MVYSLFGTKSLPDHLLIYVCRLVFLEQRNTVIFIQDNALENAVCKMLTILFKPRPANCDSMTKKCVITPVISDNPVVERAAVTLGARANNQEV